MQKDKIVNIIVGVLTILVALIIIYPLVFTVTLDVQKYSSAILAFLTLLYVLLTFYMVKSNSRSLKEQLRPYIVVTFPINYNRVYFSIKNIGKRPAKNVKIEIDPGVETIQRTNLKGNCDPLLFQTFIAPDQEVTNLVDLLPFILENQSEKIFNIKAIYEDLSGDIFNESFIITLSNYLYDEIIINKDINGNLKSISKNLETIANILKK